MSFMKPSLIQAYGSYEIPDMIQRLFQLSHSLAAQGIDMSMIGFRMEDSYFAYSITPPDLIPFASTGGDGIHFGFLTEFGRISQLEEASIVCVTPTDDPPIRLMARNLQEFLDLIVSVHHVETLERWWAYKGLNQPPWEEEAWADDTPLWLQEHHQVIQEALKQHFGAAPRPVLPYFQEILLERQQNCAIDTSDGLGIVGSSAASAGRYPFRDGCPEDEAELQRMSAFFMTSCLEEKLAMLRDLNFRYVHDAMGPPSPVFELMQQFLLSLVLQAEADRMFVIDRFE
ncbi:hypothetical protein ACH6EH_03415 [Paenibacillus sp. JSM ZJ436]|uniref:hypothetical protein n=1 Tax=Paenibacillus sp. JSM ZJ436 TaxID=3376190 RepID=UPI003796EB93